MPEYTTGIDVCYPIAVDVNLIISRQSLHLLGHTPLRPVLFIQEWRYDGNPRPVYYYRNQMSLSA